MTASPGTHERRHADANRRLLVERFRIPPPGPGAVARITERKVQNLLTLREEEAQRREVLTSLPAKLTVEPANVCNLRCPGCFTGAGRQGRPRGPMGMALYERLLDELGPYLFEVELCNWGEPMLARELEAMIERATRAGIATQFTTNLSLHVDANRARALVESGLSVLGVSIDGATQKTYEAYRVRGDLALVLDNCRLIADAKQRAGSRTPQLIWSFHGFPHNVDELDEARRQAEDLGMTFAATKGWVRGEDWTAGKRFPDVIKVDGGPCSFLWRQAIVNNDGGVAPCCGTFESTDDMGTLATDGRPGADSFADVWNNERFRRARRMFGANAADTNHTDDVCAGCPMTRAARARQTFVDAGGEPNSFQSSYVSNDMYNYFWSRIRAMEEPIQLRRPRA